MHAHTRPPTPLDVVWPLLAEGRVRDDDLCPLSGLNLGQRHLALGWLHAVLVDKDHVLPALGARVGNHPPLRKLRERERRGREEEGEREGSKVRVHVHVYTVWNGK